MKTNIGAFDGAIRVLIFIVLLANAVIQGTLAAWLWLIPGVILFATALMTWCAFYEILGINTARK